MFWHLTAVWLSQTHPLTETQDGNVWGWGLNDCSQLGIGDVETPTMHAWGRGILQPLLNFHLMVRL